MKTLLSMSLPYFTLLSQRNGELTNLIDIETSQNGCFVLFQDSQYPEFYLTCQAGNANHFNVIDNFYTLAERHGLAIRTLADYFNPVMSGSFNIKNSSLTLQIKHVDQAIADTDLEDLLYQLILNSGYKLLELED